MKRSGSASLNSFNVPAKVMLPRVIPAFLLSLCLWLSLGPAAASADTPSDTEERIVGMERELDLLQQRNEDLEKELHSLRQALEGGEDAGLEASGQEVAQSDPPTQQPQHQGSPPAGRRDTGSYSGFYLVSEDGKNGLRLGGRITGRFTAFLTESPLHNEFSVERARLFTNVRLFDYYSLRIQVEFSPKPVLKDGYIDVHYVPWARLRLGQFKAPFSLEYQQSHKYIDFAERSLAVDNMRAIGRDIGAMLHGRVADGTFQYQLAVLSGKGENRSDDNSAKDVAGRLVLRPFLPTRNEVLRGAQLGVSATWGRQDADFSDAQLVTIAGTPFVDFTAGTELRGERTRVGAEFVWLVGPASLKTEWMWMWLTDFRLPPVSGDFDFRSGYVSASYLLTGEKKTLGQITPEHPFKPWKGEWGAWELAARYSLYLTDGDLFRLGMASGTRRVDAFGAGLNWYLNQILRVSLTYEHSKFKDDLVVHGEVVEDENAFLLQCQLEF
jgi:phosphate-selective porin OprO/OprP